MGNHPYRRFNCNRSWPASFSLRSCSLYTVSNACAAMFADRMNSSKNSFCADTHKSKGRG